MPLPIQVRDDLTVSIGKSAVTLTTSECLALAERLARASFRRAAIEETAAVTPQSNALVASEAGNA